MPLPSKRDHAQVRQQLHEWLGTKLPPNSKHEISALDIPEGTGMSSETFLFDASWSEAGRPRTRSYVVRMSPDMSDFPTFPAYDLALQVESMRLVAARSDVPVPTVAWYEPDDAALGTPFYVMEKVEGLVPPDVPPYVFGGWLADASEAERARLERSSLGVLAKLHAIEIDDEARALLDRPKYGKSGLDQHLAYQREYYDWAREGVDYPVIERTFAWLHANRPIDEGATVLNWGDSRIGNMMYRDFEPVAVLDWEMAALGPREVDLAWMVQMHDFFSGFSEALKLPGIPGLLDRDRVIATYEELSGHRVQNFDWYFVFGALRFMIVCTRTSARAIAYGQMEPVATPDEAVTNRHQVEAYIG